LMKEIAYVTVAKGRIRSQRCSRIKGLHKWIEAFAHYMAAPMV
jgi:hypothetical protein